MATVPNWTSARRQAQEVRESCEGMMKQLCDRLSIVDGGEWSAFPSEGLCWLRLEQEPSKEEEEEEEEGEEEDLARRGEDGVGERAGAAVRTSGERREPVLWPAWLLARGTENWDGFPGEEDAQPAMGPDGSSHPESTTRVVCCYGSGWSMRVEQGELMAFEDQPELGPEQGKGGKLYKAAVEEARARKRLGEDAKENANFASLVVQNLDMCQHPVLVGRVFSAHLRRAKTRPAAGQTLAIRWNENDWWQARIARVGADVAEAGGRKGAAIEVVYDDDDATEETIVKGSDVWRDDVRCLCDDRSPEFDDDDRDLLKHTELRLAASEKKTPTNQKASPKKKKKKKTKIQRDEYEDEPVYKDEALMEELPAPNEDADDGDFVDDDAGPKEDDDDDDDDEEEDQQPEEEVTEVTEVPKPETKAKPPRPEFTRAEVDAKKAAARKRRADAARDARLAAQAEETAERKRMLEEATSRWTVSNSSSRPLSASRSGLDNPVKNAVEDKKIKPPEAKKKTKSKPPDIMALLRSATSKPLPEMKRTSSSLDKKSTKAPADNAAGNSTVAKALEEAKLREARLLRALDDIPDPAAGQASEEKKQTPGVVAASSSENEQINALPVADTTKAGKDSSAPAETRGVPPRKRSDSPRALARHEQPQVKRHRVASSSEGSVGPVGQPLQQNGLPAGGLPPGWMAKWSTRKQMYYYFHNTTRVTRWTPPTAADQGPEAAVPAFATAVPKPPTVKTSYSAADDDSDDDVPYYTAPPPVPPVPPRPPSALDAARRSLAACEAAIRPGPERRSESLSGSDGQARDPRVRRPAPPSRRHSASSFDASPRESPRASYPPAGAAAAPHRHAASHYQAPQSMPGASGSTGRRLGFTDGPPPGGLGPPFPHQQQYAPRSAGQGRQRGPPPSHRASYPRAAPNRYDRYRRVDDLL